MKAVSGTPKSDPFYHRPTDSGVDFSRSVDLGFQGFDFGLDTAINTTEHAHEEANILPSSEYSSAISSAISPHTGGVVNQLWPADDFTKASVPKPFAKPISIQNNSTNHSPQSSNGAPAYESGMEHVPKATFDPTSIHMYHDLLTDNLSTHDLTSPDGAFIMTPPTDTPTLPWMANELHNRRTSDSSELANNFASNLHMQQHGVGLGVSTTTVSPSNVFRSSLSTPPVLTPDISPDQATAKPTSSFDLASRRNAQRPEPLRRPTAERSHSYGGPPTTSPRQRVPSHALKSSKSSNVLSGRVSKPGSASASPRHIQMHLDCRRPSAVPSYDGRDESVHSINRGNFANFAQISPAASVHSASSYWEANGTAAPQIYGNPNGYSSVPDLSAVAMQPQSSLSQQASSRREHSLPSDYDTPQSAPSHQTTFNLPDSPSIHGEAFSGQHWPVSDFPSGLNVVASQLPISRSNFQTGAQSFGSPGYQPPFAPKVHPGFLTAQSYFPSWSQHPVGYNQSPAQPERDFKVELETKPDQIFVKTSSNEFNFANSTPVDYSSSGGKKK